VEVKLELNAPLNAPLNETQEEILKAIQNNPNISYDEIAEVIDKNRTTVMRSIQKLKEYQIIERVGSDKNGYWKLSLNAIAYE
jgi:ATP-dependent DNA helicase RecG